jgi:hypothetical protein
VEGRVIVCAHPSRPNELLYLFTTLDLPAGEIFSLYKLRWNVETDLRSLKHTVGLHHLSSKSVDMVEKELLLAMAAYNLVRAVMCLAAQLSFSFVQTVVEAALPSLESAARLAKRNTSNGWIECCAMPPRASSPNAHRCDPIPAKSGAGVDTFRRARGKSKEKDKRNDSDAG